MNLKENKEEYLEGLEGEREGEISNYIIISKLRENNKMYLCYTKLR